MYKVSAHYLLHFTFLPSIIVYVQQSMIHDRERERTRRLIFISIDPIVVFSRPRGRGNPSLYGHAGGEGFHYHLRATYSLTVRSLNSIKSQIYALYTLRWISRHEEVVQVTNQKETSLYLPTEKPLLFLMTFKLIFPTNCPYHNSKWTHSHYFNVK